MTRTTQAIELKPCQPAPVVLPRPFRHAEPICSQKAGKITKVNLYYGGGPWKMNGMDLRNNAAAKSDPLNAPIRYA